MKVLVIDDDAQIRRLASVALGAKGWEVLVANDAAEGLYEIRGKKPDVVLLDLNLPDKTGREFLLELRAWCRTPVVVVTVRDSAEDIIDLLSCGADDYVVKPFHIEVLCARVEAVRRRVLPEGVEPVALGELSFDPDRRELRRGGEIIKLTPTEFSLLELLLRNAGKIVTRDRILRELWGPAGEAEEGSLRVHISALRKKLEADPGNPRLIITEPGVGYRLAT